jgi:hypothetical protein
MSREKSMSENMQMDPYFMQLVLSLQMGTMQHMGKIVSPVSGKVERDLEMAKHSIQMLEMIHRKSSNSLSDDERNFIEGVLYELRLNYVDEVSKEGGGSTASSQGTSDDKNPTTSADNQEKAES